MHWLTILGIFSIAFGTSLTFIGQNKQNEETIINLEKENDTKSNEIINLQMQLHKKAKGDRQNKQNELLAKMTKNHVNTLQEVNVLLQGVNDTQEKNLRDLAYSQYRLGSYVEAVRTIDKDRKSIHFKTHLIRAIIYEAFVRSFPFPPESRKNTIKEWYKIALASYKKSLDLVSAKDDIDKFYTFICYQIVALENFWILHEIGYNEYTANIEENSPLRKKLDDLIIFINSNSEQFPNDKWLNKAREELEGWFREINFEDLL